MANGLAGLISNSVSTLASIVSHQVAFINKVKQAQVQQQPSNPPPPGSADDPLYTKSFCGRPWASCCAAKGLQDRYKLKWMPGLRHA